ncbi:MAG TPA: hypothetical protein VHY91_08860 [Pirellulales bacterium]|jgi:hypothetical protein|nr:hypothetical protein [Pirellulales bacterium]
MNPFRDSPTSQPQAAPTPIDRSLRPALLIGLAALAASAVGGWQDPEQFFRAYLAVYQFFLGIGLGCLVLLMIYYLTGGAWGFVIRPILESGARTLPLLAIGFLPIALGVKYIYPWAQPDLLERSVKLQFQHSYLNEPCFWARSAVYFLAWLLLAYLLCTWSEAHERTGEARYWRRCVNLSGPGLVLYGLAIHFASTDWIMSLESDFHSTIFGPLTVSGHLVSALALAIFVLPWLAGREPLSSILSPKVLNDLGNLLLSFVVIAMYMEWFQFMLVWIANVQVDVVWYAPRLRGGWQWLALGLFLLHFAVPFCVLLLRRVKQNLVGLQTVAAVVLIAHLVFLDYQVLPTFAAEGLGRHWIDFVLPVAWAGIWWAQLIHCLRDRRLLALHDPNAGEAQHLRAVDEEEAHWEEVLEHV